MNRRGWSAEYLPLEPIEPGTALPVRLEEVNGSCDVCGKDAFDNCYNCEDRVCPEHGHPWLFTKHAAERGGGVAFTLCGECVRLSLDMKIFADLAIRGAAREGMEMEAVDRKLGKAFRLGKIPRYVEDFDQTEEGYAVVLRPEEEWSTSEGER